MQSPFIRRALALALLSVAAVADEAAPAAPASCVAADAVATARWLFAHREQLYGPDGPLAAVMSEPLAAALRAEQACVRRTDEVCALDADLWTNAQEGVIVEPIGFEEIARADTRASVRVSYGFSLWEDGRDAKPAATLVQLVRADAAACWLLDDLVGAQAVSLREMLVTVR